MLSLLLSTLVNVVHSSQAIPLLLTIAILPSCIICQEANTDRFLISLVAIFSLL